MPKRYGKVFESSFSSSVKKAKLEIISESSRQISKGKQKSTAGKVVIDEDLWGDDFAEEDIEEMDFIASQACSQAVDKQVETKTLKKTSGCVKSSINSCSSSTSLTRRSVLSDHTSKQSTFQPKIPSKLFINHASPVQKIAPELQSQTLASSENTNDFFEDNDTMVFEDFKNKLLKTDNHNSTFHLQKNVIITDDARLREMEKLKLQNKKLLDDILIKEGETVFLRHQLQQTQLRAENDKMEKARSIEEQSSRYRAEISAAYKEKENLRTQLEFQTLQLGKLMEKCKLLESGSIRFIEPHAVNTDVPNRSRFNTTINRSSSMVKTVKVTESSVQTTVYDKISSKLKTHTEHYPLSRIPQSIFESSLPEKSVVDIQIVEKIGKRNLPILQDEETFRIFENPDLVKPIVTIVDNRKLNVEFFLSDVAAIMKKTSAEINSNDTIPIINKLVLTARELLLNSTIVLQTISRAMKNDDIRDMNDVYFSNFYEMPVDYTKSICDADVWYEKERGIEARRAFGTLSYVTLASTYLSEYIAGKTPLLTDNDSSYKNYIKQMSSYNTWPKKNHNFEILDMLLEFVTVVGLVRRSHQFSGLISAIIRILCNVQKKVGFCSRGLNYVFNIFKEIVFSRPLAFCYMPLTKVMMTFGKCTTFVQRLCNVSESTKLTIWKDALHFTSDACALEIYIAQIHHFQLGPITTVKITQALISFTHSSLSTNSIPWTIENINSCNCCMKLVILVITLLYKCSTIKLDTMENCNKVDHFSTSKRETTHLKEDQLNNVRCDKTKICDKKLNNKEILFSWTNLHKSFWKKMKNKQLDTLRKGIRFLCYIAMRDPDFTNRLSEIEESFNLFMQNISSFSDLVLHENEQEALNLIKSTYVFDRATSFERCSQSQQLFDFKSNFERKLMPASTDSQWFIGSNVNNSSQQSPYKTMFEKKNKSDS